VRFDCIEATDLTIAEAAKHMQVQERQLRDVCDGLAPITAELAIRLDLAFGGTAETWLALQTAYNLAQARRQHEDIEVKRVEYAA
jgi:addiction module HigA family antidote